MHATIDEELIEYNEETAIATVYMDRCGRMLHGHLAGRGHRHRVLLALSHARIALACLPTMLLTRHRCACSYPRQSLMCMMEPAIE
jgi:hypothetical protein